VLRTRLAWAGIAALATYLVFIGGGWLGIYTPELRIATMLGAAALLAGWWLAARRSAFWRPQSALLPAIFAALASLAISTLFSRVPRVSLEYLGYAVVLAALYLLLVRLLAHPFFARRLLVLASFFFAAIASAFLILVVVHWLEWWPLLGRFAVPPLRPNFEGLTYFNPSAVLTMVALFAIPTAALVDWHTHRGRLFLGVVLAVVAVVAFLSGSRAGWFAIGLTIIVTAALALSRRERRAAVQEAVADLLAQPRARLGAGLVLVAIVVVGVAFGPGILRRIGEGGDEARLQYAISASRMFIESPLVGTGPGSWVIQRQAYTNAGEADVSIPHAHDVPVQTLAEQGLVGIIAGAIVLWILGRLIGGALRDPVPMRSRFAWGTLIGLVYFGFHQLLDFYANMPAALFAAAVPLAYLDASRSAARDPMARIDATSAAGAPRDRWSSPQAWARVARSLVPATVVVVVIAITGLVVQELPALSSARAVDLANRGAWADADGSARQAASADPDVDAYAMTAGLTAAHAGDHSAAVAYFQRVADRDDLPEAWVDLAAEQVLIGDVPAARATIPRAARLGLHEPALAMAVAGLALELGLRDLAVESIAGAVSGNPTVAADPWWNDAPERRRALDAAVDRLLGDSGTSVLRWEVALMAGRSEEARKYAALEPDPAFSELVVDAWLGNPAALSEVVDECASAPLDEDRLVWCARATAHAGEAARSLDMQKLLETLGPGLSGRSMLLVSDPRNGDAAGNLARFWGTFTYRRSTPADMLVPSLVHLKLH
jgi:tetratricopeptide (TPR) repeat protein